MIVRNPIETIKEYRSKGYLIEVTMDSSRPVYSVSMTAQNDVKRFYIHIDSLPLQKIQNAVRGKK